MFVLTEGGQSSWVLLFMGIMLLAGGAIFLVAWKKLVFRHVLTMKYSDIPHPKGMEFNII